MGVRTKVRRMKAAFRKAPSVREVTSLPEPYERRHLLELRNKYDARKADYTQWLDPKRDVVAIYQDHISDKHRLEALGDGSVRAVRVRDDGVIWHMQPEQVILNLSRKRRP